VSTHIVDTAPTDPVAVALIAELSAELAARYAAQFPVVADGRSNYRPDAFNPERDAFVTAWRDGDAVGCGALRQFDAHRAEVKRMYVRPAGRGLGVGRLLLSALESRATAKGYRAVLLETGVLQPEAIQLYTQAGYEPHPPWPPYDTRDYALCFQKQLLSERE
jgi:putative acetyltransferase